MGPNAIVFVVTIAIGALAFAGAAALIKLIGKNSVRGRARTTWLCAAFALAAIVAIGMWAYASIYYVKPVGWIVALAAAGITVATLFALIGMDVRWRPNRLLALVGLFIAAGIAFSAFSMMMSGIIGLNVEGIFPYTTRARQIAEAKGFTALMPKRQKLQTDSLPIDALPAPDQGVSFVYEGFNLQERKAKKSMTEADLKKLVAPGASPTQEVKVTSDAKVTSHTVQGKPAVAVEDQVIRSGGPGATPKKDTYTVLVLELDGVDVRLSASSGEKLSSDGTWVPFRALTVEQLVKIAETLAPVE
ncbi:MAG: hypothetical protein Q8L35_06860 [Actinomycetota bacterium]|nr:hypothetical protein [Actinomycetota bacterium]